MPERYDDAILIDGLVVANFSRAVFEDMHKAGLAAANCTCSVWHDFRATMANIRQNVTIALGLKAVFLVTTVLGMTGLWIAILADTGATVLVTLNALRLLRFNPDREA